jgi:urea transport system ATP-binding protein
MSKGSAASYAKGDAVRSDSGVILYVENISVSFDGFNAITDLSLCIDEGSLHCIIGPNGAGKTTLLDIITGKTKPTAGQVVLGQNLVLTERTEWEIARLGIGRKFQKPTVFENLTLEENLELAFACDKGVRSTLFAKKNELLRQATEETLQTIALTGERRLLAGLLSHGQKQWLEIGMLLMQAPRVLLLDEPAAGMTPHELELSVDLLKSLAGRHTVVVIEHDMDFVRAIAQRVTVLHEGRVLAEGNMDFVQNDPRVVEVYLGA